MNRIEDEPTRFYLEHEALIREWAGLEAGVRKFADRFYRSLEGDLAAALRSGRIADDAVESFFMEYPSYRGLVLRRHDWPKRSEDPDVRLEWKRERVRFSDGGIRLPGAGLIFSSGNGRKWTEPPGKLLHDEVVPAQICRHRGVGLCGCEGVGNEGRLAGRRTCAEHVAVESAHGRLAVPLSPRQLVGASSAATVGPGGSLAGRWVWRLPRRIPVPHGGARPRGSRRWRRRDEDTRRGPTPRTAASCLVAFPPLAAKPTGRGLGRRRDGAD